MRVGRWASLFGAAVAVVLTAATAATAATVQANTPESLGFVPPECPHDGQFQACIYGLNNAQVFTAPGQLSPANYFLYSTDKSWGHDANPWPSVWSGVPQNPTCPPKPGDQWCARFNSSDLTSGDTSAADYVPQWPMPGWDVVSLYQNNPYKGKDSASCPAVKKTNYTTCSGTTSHGDYTNDTFIIQNAPITMQIVNNLPTGGGAVPYALQLVTQPFTTPAMVMDPVGGLPCSIAPGTTGYFGAYQPIQSAGLAGGAPVFSAVFQIVEASSIPTPSPSPSTPGTCANWAPSNNPPAPASPPPALLGAMFIITVTSDGNGGVVQSQTTCEYLYPSYTTRSAATCLTPPVNGAAKGPQTVIFDIQE